MPARKKAATKSAPPPLPEPLAAPPEPAPPPEQVAVVEAKLENVRSTGDLSPAVIDQMITLIPPDVIARKINSMLHATRWIGNGDFLREVPDTRAQEAAVKLYLAYVVGLPVQRVETINRTIGEVDDLMDRAAQSPALVRTMERTLEAIKARREGETGENPT